MARILQADHDRPWSGAATKGATQPHPRTVQQRTSDREQMRATHPDPAASHDRTHHHGRLHVSVQHRAARRSAVRAARPFCISPIRRHLTMASNMPGSMSESIFPNNPPGSQQQIRGSLKPIPSHARSRPHGTTATISTASSARCDFYKRPQWDRSELGSTQTRIRSSFSKASSDRPFCRSMRGRSTHDLQQRLQIGTRANSGLKQGSSGLRDPRRMGRCKSGGHVHLAARAAGDDQHLSAHISSPFAPFQLVAELH